MKKLMRILILLLSAVILFSDPVCGVTLKHNSEYWQKELPMGFHDLVRDKDGTVVRAVDNEGIIWFFIQYSSCGGLWGYGFRPLGRLMKEMLFMWDLEYPDWAVSVYEMKDGNTTGNMLWIKREEANAEVAQTYLTTKGLLPPGTLKCGKEAIKRRKKIDKAFARYVDKYGCDGEKAGSKKTVQMKKYNNLIKKHPETAFLIQACIEEQKFNRVFDEYSSMCGCRADKTASKKVLCEEKLNSLIKTYPEDGDFIKVSAECMTEDCDSGPKVCPIPDVGLRLREMGYSYSSGD